MSQRPLLVLFVMIFAAAAALGQQKPADDAGKLDKEAVELLRETSAEVGRLRTLENRISFNAEIASLMWFHDDKEARAMYGEVVAEFKQLLSQFDAQMNAFEQPDEDEFSGGIFGGYGRPKVERKFQIAMNVRKQIALSLAEHAPDLAYNFYFDSINAISNPKFRKQAEGADNYFEGQLMQKIAAADAAKGVEYGRASLKAGLEVRHIELLKKIYEKDVDKGVEFGAAVLSQLRNDKSKIKGYYLYESLLRFGSTNLEEAKKNSKKPVYEYSDLRDIAEMLATALLDGAGSELLGYGATQYLDLIGKYSPGRAAQLKAKMAKSEIGPSNIPQLRTVNIASNSSRYGSGNMAYPANSNAAAAKWKEDHEAREKREKELMEGIKGVGSKELPKEERDKMIARSRAIIATTPGKDKKLTALCLLAAQAARAGDKELAGEIMRDAERLVNPQPKNYRDFLLQLMLASGYAEVDPQKAFPVLESLILRNNELTSAMLKVAEFIDVNSEIIDDGEVQVGMFGGEMIRGLTGELGIANGTIRTLAKADFAKTKNLTNVFDRTETRVLAKMLVLRAVLDKKGSDKPEEELLKELSPDN